MNLSNDNIRSIFKKNIIILGFLVMMSTISLAFNEAIISPSSCADSKNDCQLNNVQSQNGISESQKGHPISSKFIETVNRNSSVITSQDLISNVTAYIDRFESANPRSQTIKLTVKRPSDNSEISCILPPKTTNDENYDICDVTQLITSSSSKESDVENLTINYNIMKFGASNIFYLDHVYVKILYSDLTPPQIDIIAPKNQTYSQNHIELSVNLSETTMWVVYALDELSNLTMVNYGSTIWNASISNLPNGLHTIKFYANDSYNNIGTNSVVFSVDATLLDMTGPIITVLSPENKTLAASPIELNISLNENGSDVVYSIDGAPNASLGNTSLRNWNKTIVLADGYHNIIFYANDTSTNKNAGNSTVIYFAVDTQPPSIEININDGSEIKGNATVINVSANVSDNMTLDKVILQYKSITEINWNESVMINEGGIYKNNFIVSTGNYTFRVYANDTANNTNVSNETNISVVGNNEKSDTPIMLSQPSSSSLTSSGGGGSTIITENSTKKVSFDQEILSSFVTTELVDSYNHSFSLTIKNIFNNTTMHNISAKIQGFLSDYIDVLPTMIDRIEYNGEKWFNFTVNLPENIEEGNYNLTVNITGKITGLNTERNLAGNRTFTLSISLTKEREAIKLITLAGSEIETMKTQKFPTSNQLKLLEEAKNSLKTKDYENVKLATEKIKNQKNMAFAANDIISKIKSELRRSEPVTGAFLRNLNNFKKTEDLIELSIIAFEREDYKTALERARYAEQILIDEQKKENGIISIANYWPLYTVMIVISSLFGIKYYYNRKKSKGKNVNIHEI